MSRICFYFLILTVLACEPFPTVDDGKRVKDNTPLIIDAISFSENGGTWFSDMGSPMGFKLHEPASIGFVGPYCTDHELTRVQDLIDFEVLVDGEIITERASIKQHSEPGLLVQQLTWSDLYIELRLFFMTSDIAVMGISAQNTSKRILPVDFIWPSAVGYTPNRLLNYPPTKKTINDSSFTPQRINFLSYEHRSLHWIIQDDAELIFQASPPHRPLAGQEAYEQNCDLWRKRTTMLLSSENEFLNTQCLQLFYSTLSESDSILDSQILSFPNVDHELLSRFDLLAPTEIEYLKTDQANSQLRLLQDPDLVDNVLATLLHGTGMP